MAELHLSDVLHAARFQAVEPIGLARTSMFYRSTRTGESAPQELIYSGLFQDCPSLFANSC